MSNHLRCVGKLPVGQGKISSARFFVEDKIAYTAIDRSLQVFSLRELPAVQQIASLDMNDHIQGIASKNKILYLNTRTRGINLLDIRMPSEPVLIDCLPYLGRSCGKLFVLNNYLIVSWERDKMIGLFDISSERKPVLLHELVLDQDVDDMILQNDKIIIANDKDGMAVLAISDNRLVVEKRFLTDTKFSARYLLNGQRGLYVFGYSEDENIYLLDNNDVTNIIARTGSDITNPCMVLDTDTEMFVFHSHYTCTRFNENYETEAIFRQYFADADKRYYEISEAEREDVDERCTCMDEPLAGYSIDNYLLTIQENQFMVWTFPEGSALTGAQVAR